MNTTSPFTQQLVLCKSSLPYLKTIPDNFYDSCVTDSPYGFGKEPDPVKVLTAWLDHGYLEIKGKGFMGAKWDAFVPQPIFWKEVFRVLKPGAFLLSFFGTRTYDWGVMAIRLAGFEIKDQILWVYGSGFPKSMDISRAIDKKEKAEREIVGVSSVTGKRKKSTIDDKNGIKNEKRIFSNENEKINYKSIAATKYAKIWDGWGTALKPAVEPIVVAQKPISEKTIVANVLKWGTGALNINGSRIAINEQGNLLDLTQHPTGNADITSRGRFPANIILDPIAAELLDKQAPDAGAYAPVKTMSGDLKSHNVYGNYNKNGDDGLSFYADTGGASRFFYCAKASPEERNKGCENIQLSKKATHSRFDICETCGGYILQGENRPSKCHCEHPIRSGAVRSGNTHPTVKPISLIRYLVKLVTPKYGHCLDPFCGSGTTGVGCKLEFINATCIDEDPDSCIISEARIKAWNPEKYIPQNMFDT